MPRRIGTRRHSLFPMSETLGRISAVIAFGDTRTVNVADLSDVEMLAPGQEARASGRIEVAEFHHEVGREGEKNVIRIRTLAVGEDAVLTAATGPDEGARPPKIPGHGVPSHRDPHR